MNIIDKMYKEYARFQVENSDQAPKYLILSRENYNEFVEYCDRLKNLRVGYQIHKFMGALVLMVVNAPEDLLVAVS